MGPVTWVHYCKFCVLSNLFLCFSEIDGRCPLWLSQVCDTSWKTESLGLFSVGLKAEVINGVCPQNIKRKEMSSVRDPEGKKKKYLGGNCNKGGLA